LDGEGKTSPKYYEGYLIMLYLKIKHHLSAKDYRKQIDESLSLKFRENLNYIFWNKNVLKSQIRRALLKFGNAFAEYVGIDTRIIKDILLLGGNAGYNYTSYSDLDVHLVVDPNDLPQCNSELLQDYFKDKKTLWSLTHNVKIYGSDVEPYIEQPGIIRKKSQGVYSLVKNKWIQEPEKFEGDLDERELEKKVKNMKDRIDTLILGNNEIGLKNLLKKLKNSRKSSIDKYGEYGFENLVFKELRNIGYLDKVRRAVIELKNKKLSLP
jgi:hypothetical protein